MRAKPPLAPKPQKDHTPYLSVDNDRPVLPLTRFSEKATGKASRARVITSREIKERALRENIMAQGLDRMLQKVPRKND